jgi:hypothetical protein
MNYMVKVHLKKESQICKTDFDIGNPWILVYILLKSLMQEA